MGEVVAPPADALMHAHHDFAAALPLLDAPARQWLRDALVRIHPEHHWIAMLATQEGRE